mgnify:CR=1 FL=1
MFMVVEKGWLDSKRPRAFEVEVLLRVKVLKRPRALKVEFLLSVLKVFKRIRALLEVEALLVCEGFKKATGFRGWVFVEGLKGFQDVLVFKRTRALEVEALLLSKGFQKATGFIEVKVLLRKLLHAMT